MGAEQVVVKFQKATGPGCRHWVRSQERWAFVVAFAALR